MHARTHANRRAQKQHEKKTAQKTSLFRNQQQPSKYLEASWYIPLVVLRLKPTPTGDLLTSSTTTKTINKIQDKNSVVKLNMCFVLIFIY